MNLRFKHFLTMNMGFEGQPTKAYDFGLQNRCCPAILAIPESYLTKKQS